MSKRYNGSDPINARIKIDYSKEKPQVSFRFPDKRTQYKGSMLSAISLCVSFIIIPIFLIATYALSFSQVEYLYGGMDGLADYSKCVAQYPYTTQYNYSKVRYDLCESYIVDKEVLKRIWLYMSWIFLIFFGIPAIIYYPFRKKWDKLYPNWMAWKSLKKLAIFKPKDVQESGRKDYPYFVELPVFSNVVCDYRATKDFSKYMKEFEIEEHKFCYLRKKRIRVGKKKKKFKKINEWLWYARWYFNKKPMKGEMKVLFK
jgi:hypothetical protein